MELRRAELLHKYVLAIELYEVRNDPRNADPEIDPGHRLCMLEILRPRPHRAACFTSSLRIRRLVPGAIWRHGGSLEVERAPRRYSEDAAIQRSLRLWAQKNTDEGGNEQDDEKPDKQDREPVIHPANSSRHVNASNGGRSRPDNDLRPECEIQAGYS